MLPVSILYLDEALVAIDKPAGMIVHPGRDEEGPEWIAMKRVRDMLCQQVYPVHRLDRPTSGVLLFALTPESCVRIQQSFERRQVEKTYLAVAEGTSPLQWTCEKPLQRTPSEPAQPSKTDFERLAVIAEGFNASVPDLSLSLLKASPYTGRYHQIRRHLVEAGHPIIGDFRYAGAEHSMKLGDALGTGTRMLLQAKSLILPHPVTGESLEITAPADADFLRCFPALEEELRPVS
ncbi:pseudouridine synthase [Luteolibacter flavescens]|uniref:tRNA pseudouridine synthase C n=1 Tax=Luteolibacter flavescens TaxID=1859460 RepID=A0ABT3FJG2_9BACT|nr:pseudouridine synthase [Luteolibacter flavescens]MCW1883597.1 pseudouridine synthase [Luteolibacter flavescens]